MRDIMEISYDWINLIEAAKDEYIFNKPMDLELFKKCMKDTFEVFIKTDEVKNSFNKEEMFLFAQVYAYQHLISVEEGNNSKIFDASCKAAYIFARTILNPDVSIIDGYKMTYTNQNTQKALVYDFESGDLDSFME